MKSDRRAARTSFLQLIGVVATALIIATLTPRFDAMARRIDQSERAMNQRFEDFQRAQDKRFDDFKQELRTLLKK